ncbi:MAG: RNA polymerase sigma factor [Deferribacteres bacterium]|nr:RNA polymerase sigma factor [candidate division KSB1 bacterium]MCB9511137.1 RNA polymerase sigma factor [Deferribacteres bacterium]
MSQNHATLSVEAFQQEYLELHARLTSYLFRLTANRQDAEDLAHDTYLKAIKNLNGFAGKASLKTWLFAIATNLARDHHRVQQRWKEDTQDRCREDTQAAPEKVEKMRAFVAESPAERYEFHEHIDYCFTCIAKSLDIEQQLTVILREIYGFKISDIMEILGQTEGRVKYALSQARSKLSEIYQRRCELVNKNGACWQCGEINDFIRPGHSSQQQLHQIEIRKQAESGTAREKLLDLRFALIKNFDPFSAPGAALHEYLLKLMPESVR